MCNIDLYTPSSPRYYLFILVVQQSYRIKKTALTYSEKVNLNACDRGLRQLRPESQIHYQYQLAQSTAIPNNVVLIRLILLG